jgi:hypothetical protein
MLAPVKAEGVIRPVVSVSIYWTYLYCNLQFLSYVIIKTKVPLH